MATRLSPLSRENSVCDKTQRQDEHSLIGGAFNFVVHPRYAPARIVLR